MILQNYRIVCRAYMFVYLYAFMSPSLRLKYDVLLRASG